MASEDEYVVIFVRWFRHDRTGKIVYPKAENHAEEVNAFRVLKLGLDLLASASQPLLSIAPRAPK